MRAISRNLIYLLILVLASGRHDKLFAALEGEVRLYGKVTASDSGEPLPGATVSIAGLNLGDVTNDDGEFSISHLKKGRYTVVCQFLGYREIERQVTVIDNLKIDFSMESRILELSEVTVTADKEKTELTRSRQSVAVLESEELSRQRGQTLGETIEDLPGVTTLQTGPSISKPVVRGLHSQRVLVINAGIHQEGQQWGAEHAPEIDPFSPARIEVLRGAASVEYGANAIGGVVRVEPRELTSIRGFGGQFSANVFSNNLQGAGSLLVEGRLPLGRPWGWRLQGSFRKAGDSRTPDFVISNSAFEEKDWSFATGYHSDRGGFDLYYSHFGTELGIFSGSHVGNLTDLERAIERGQPAVESEFTYEIGFPKQVIAHDLLSVKGHYNFGTIGELEAQYGYQENHRQEFDAHAPFSSEPPSRAAFDLTLFTHSGEVKFRHYPVRNLFGTIGVSGTRQGNVRGSTGFLIPNFRSYDFGVFVLENWSSGGFTLNAGARFDYRWQEVFEVPGKNIEQRVHEWHSFSGVAGFIYQFAPAWSIGTNIGTAWRPPSVNELYSDGVHHGAAQFEIGDPNLRTENSFSVDATLRNIGQRSHLEFSIYNNVINDFIFLFPEPEPRLTIRGAFPTFSYRQADAVLRGFDLTFDYQLLSFYRVGIRGSVVRGDNLDANEPLIYMPADRVRLVNRFELPSTGLLQGSFAELSVAVVREQDRFPEGDFVDPPPGYMLFDAEVGSQLAVGATPINLSLSVRNVFNVAYRDYLSRFRYYIDDPGRNIALKIQLPFGKFIP